MLEELLGSVGADTEVRPPLHVDYGTHLTIGDDVWLGNGVIVLAGVRIGTAPWSVQVLW